MSDYTNEASARALEATGQFKVLRRLKPPQAFEEDLLPTGTLRIAIVDVETEGLDPEQHAIIEMALMMIDVDRLDECEVLRQALPQSWLQDPKRPLDEKIEKITGLNNTMLHGRAIDDRAVLDGLGGAHLIIAHNARFDRAFIERRWPQLAGKAWACSCNEIDWLELGFDGRGLGHLLMQQGFFNSAHRAADDIWSLFNLLTSEPAGIRDERTRSHLDRLVEASETETYRLEATNAPFRAKDALKARGYRWDPARRVWWTEIKNDNFLEEKIWFEEQNLPVFTFTTLDATQRHL